MHMSISKDLFLAILSMDAYNRGYGAGITDGQHIDGNGTDHALCACIAGSSGLEAEKQMIQRIICPPEPRG